ncbi:hypothetical protein C356_00511 [Cryptococcus neoformans c45]|nr:hypothetical protein C356_00511 [Cryptococcus neoformans var. grubii c45]
MSNPSTSRQINATEAKTKALRLASLKFVLGDLPEQCAAYYLRDHHLQEILSIASQARTPSFIEKLKTLTFMDSESVIQTLGYKRGEPRSTTTDYRHWDPSRISEYSKALQEEAAGLRREREHVQILLEGSGSDRLQVLLQDMNTHLEELKNHRNMTWDDGACTQLDVLRRAYNVAQSHLTINQMLPDIATKIYDDLCSLHNGASRPLTGKNKNRSRPWTKALSELRFAVSNLHSSTWDIDPDLLVDIEKKADGFFTETTERQEGPIRKGHMDALTKRDSDGPTYGSSVQRYTLTRLKELESYVEAKRGEVAEMVNTINTDWEECSGGPNFKWNEVTIPRVARQNVANSWFGMSSSTPFAQGKATVESPSHHDYFLECMIPYIPSKVDYTPDLSALKPMPQVAFNCFSELQQDINSHAQRLLSEQPRNKMVPSQNVKYNTAISSAMKEIVDRSKAKWEEMATQMNDSTFASEDLEAHSALMSRAVSNYFTLSALYTEHNGPAATTKEGCKAWATSAQKDREEAKKWEKNVEEWHASRTNESIDVSSDGKEASQQLDAVTTQIDAATVSETHTIAPQQLTELEKLFIANGLEPNAQFDWFEDVQENLPLPESTATSSQFGTRTREESAPAISVPPKSTTVSNSNRWRKIRDLPSWR